jgi:hypothetical protein
VRAEWDATNSLPVVLLISWVKLFDVTVGPVVEALNASGSWFAAVAVAEVVYEVVPPPEWLLTTITSSAPFVSAPDISYTTIANPDDADIAHVSVTGEVLVVCIQPI